MTESQLRADLAKAQGERLQKLKWYMDRHAKHADFCKNTGIYKCACGLTEAHEALAALAAPEDQGMMMVSLYEELQKRPKPLLNQASSKITPEQAQALQELFEAGKRNIVRHQQADALSAQPCEAVGREELEDALKSAKVALSQAVPLEIMKMAHGKVCKALAALNSNGGK